MGSRLRDPDKGKVGFFARKVQFGESLSQSASRCLLRETGLKADFKYRGTVHILNKKREDTKIDRLMIYFQSNNFTGEFIKRSKDSLNFWTPYNKAYKLENTFTDLAFDLDLFMKKEIFFEERYI